MPCISPPEPPDSALLAYLDGIPDAELPSHLANCAYCRDRVEQLRQEESILKSALYRAACPEPGEISDYRLGLLDETSETSMARHLNDCPFCSTELSVLDNFMKELSSEKKAGIAQQVGARIRILVARLVEAGSALDLSLGPSLAPAVAGIRGDSEVLRTYKVDDLKIVLDIQEDAEHPGKKSIAALLIGLDDLDQLEAKVWKDGIPLSTLPVAEHGGFYISELDQGVYEVLVSGPGVDLYIPNIEV